MAMVMRDPQRALLALPPAIGPLDQETLAARSEVRRMRHRARQLAKPAYVNTDAAFRDGRAGLAYTSQALGKRIAVVEARTSTEAEFLAMAMALHDADMCLSFWPAIKFRTDCTSVAHFAVVKERNLRAVRRELVVIFRTHPQWSVELIKRGWNHRANRLSREALDNADSLTGNGESYGLT